MIKWTNFVASIMYVKSLNETKLNYYWKLVECFIIRGVIVWNLAEYITTALLWKWVERYIPVFQICSLLLLVVVFDCTWHKSLPELLTLWIPYGTAIIDFSLNFIDCLQYKKCSNTVCRPVFLNLWVATQRSCSEWVAKQFHGFTFW